MENGNGETCRIHSGIVERVNDLEENQKSLWQKWDRMNALLIATLAAIVTNLVITLYKG